MRPEASHGWQIGGEAGTLLGKPSTIHLPANEAFNQDAGFSIWHWLSWVFHGVASDGSQRAADAAIPSQLTAANHIDSYPGRVWRIFHCQPCRDLDWDFAEEPTFEPQEADLLILLPGDIVAGTDMHLVRWQGLGEDALHRFGLGAFFGREAATVEHVEEVGVPPSVELVGANQFHAPVHEQLRQSAVQDSSAELGLDIVPDYRDPPAAKRFSPLHLGHQEHRHAIDQAHAGLQASAGIVLSRLLAADRQIVEQNLGLTVSQHLGHVNRWLFGYDKATLLRVVFHVRRDSIEHGPHMQSDLEAGQIRPNQGCVVGFGEGRLGKRPADLAHIHVKRAGRFDIGRRESTQFVVHQSHRLDTLFVVDVAVVFDPLQQTARAVADADDGDADFSRHVSPPVWLEYLHQHNHRLAAK